MKTTLYPEDEERLQMQPTENLEAYNLYLQGRFLWNKRTPVDMNKSIEFYEKATELNPNYATAHQWYGQHLAVMGRFEEDES